MSIYYLRTMDKHLPNQRVRRRSNRNRRAEQKPNETGVKKNNDHRNIEISKNHNEKKHIRLLVKECTNHNRAELPLPALSVLGISYPSNSSQNQLRMMKHYLCTF